jgi:ABC-type transporter Mla MlaB component
MNSLGYVIDVFSGQTTHIDTTTLQQVDVVFLCQMFHLLSYNRERVNKIYLHSVSRQSWAISEVEKITDVKLIRIQQYVDRFEEM